MKISLRKAAALQNRINETLRSIKVVTSTGLNEFHDFNSVIFEANKELMLNDIRRRDLLVALYAIRADVGAANSVSGIDARLAQAAFIDKRIQQLSELVEVQPMEDSAVIEGRIAKLAGQETSQRMRLYGDIDEVKTTVLYDGDLQKFKQEVMSLKKQKQALNDDILELNIKTEIELSRQTVVILQTEDLI